MLAELAPTLAATMRIAQTKAFVILDGTLLPIDRIAADTPYHSGKHKRHGMSVQVLTDPFGRLLWASPALPGSTHDLTSARTHVMVEALTEAGLKCWADKAYQGVDGSIRVPFRGPSPQAVAAPPQQHTRQDPLPRRTDHGHLEGLASPTEAPLQHQPHHSDRPGRPLPSPRISVRLEKAHFCKFSPILQNPVKST